MTWRNATTLVTGRCTSPGCKALHLDMFDGDELICSACVSAEDLRGMIEKFKDHLYELATEEK